MSDDWDLYAVVKSCTTAANTNPCVDENHPTSMAMDDDEDFSPNFGSVDDTPLFSYPHDHDQNDTANYPHVEGLQKIYYDFGVQTQPQQTYQPQVREHQLQLNNSMLDPPTGSTIFTNSSTSNTNRSSRRRKNQLMKTVHQMTQEELSGDSWAWRKYGQKPIKGSPYPRNYYRCSTLKGCAARRQVERSPIDSTIFIVSYTGEHTHPRPTHRSSLAGSTRSKLSTVSKPASCSSSSAANSATSFSPPLAEGELHELLQHENNMKLYVDNDIEDEDNEEEDEEEEEILIPNSVVNEEIFRGFHQLNGASGGYFGK